MGRKIILARWINTIMLINQEFPDIRLSTSIMVGFPSETEGDFQQSKKIVYSHLFDEISVYSFNERPNLPAIRLKGRIPEKRKKERFHKMQYFARLSEIRKQTRRLRSLLHPTAWISLLELSYYIMRKRFP
jgi:tRNA A37 methylthiotransferase MiaB